MASDSSILLVEDDADVRESLQEVLEEEGFHVVGATDGVDALQRLREATALPALILLDLMMPRMNGEQFRGELLKSREWADIPVLLLSADANLVTKAKALSVAGYLEKPVDLNHLIQVLNGMLSARSA